MIEKREFILGFGFELGFCNDGFKPFVDFVIDVETVEFSREIILMDARGMKASQVTNEWRTAATKGVVDVVEVQEGDRIRPGEVLVRLKAPAALGKKLEKARKAAVKLQAKLQEQELKLNEQNESFDEMNRQLEDISDELAEAESKAEKKELKAEQRKVTKRKKKIAT